MKFQKIDGKPDWFGFIPPEYYKICNDDSYSQVAGQVHFLKKFYERDSFYSDNVIRIKYKDLCFNTNRIMLEIMDRFNKITGRKLTRINANNIKMLYKSYNMQDRNSFIKPLRAYT